MKISGKHVLVVGGSSGIGAAVVRLTAAAGAVVTTASRRGEVSAISGAPRHLQLDISDEAQVGASLSGQPPFDHLVVSAGGQAGQIP